MLRATRTYMLVMVSTMMAQVESGYEYQVPIVSIQQPNQNLAQASLSTSLNAHQSVSFSEIQGNYIRHQNNGQYQHNNYNNNNKNNYYNTFENNLQKGTVSQNVHTNSNKVKPVQPIVTKHVYFHVPPPDEARPVQPQLIPRKKTYNIIFIKVPSQKPNYFLNSRGVSTNTYASVEDKTVIYVLLKKPEDQTQVLPKQSKPNHEVFYVKYKSSAKDATSQINNEVSQQRSMQSTSLRPGLINGL